jgi:hypothetical protein
MIRAAALIEDVGRYLSDFDSTGDPEFNHVTWSRRDLVSYLRMSLASLCSARPNDFSRVVEIPLVGQDIVNLPSECEQLLGLVGYRRPDGTLDTTVRLSHETERPIASRAVCAVDASMPGNLQVTLDALGPRDVLVKPATTGGSLVARCAVEPALAGDDAIIELPAKFEAVLFNWMVSYAMGTETEAVGLRLRSDEHWKRGSDLLTLSFTARKAARQAGQP